MKALLLTLIIASSALANDLDYKLSNVFTQIDAQLKAKKELHKITQGTQIYKRLTEFKKWESIQLLADLSIITQHVKQQTKTTNK